MTPNPCTTDPPIETRDLAKSFKEPVLLGVNLKVSTGQIVAILGRSGTGKSVLLKILIGIEPPDAGTVVLCGKETNGLERPAMDAIRKNVGFLFQQAALYDSMTLQENVEFPLKRHSAANGSAEKAKDLLNQVGIESGHEKLPSQISGGMKKRVGLARALALDPSILMLDEPTAGLDPITATEIMDLIRKIRDERKTTCLIVTHDLHSVRRIADRFVVLNEGTVRAEGTFEDLKASKDSFVVKFLKNAE